MLSTCDYPSHSGIQWLKCAGQREKLSVMYIQPSIYSLIFKCLLSLLLIVIALIRLLFLRLGFFERTIGLLKALSRKLLHLVSELFIYLRLVNSCQRTHALLLLSRINFINHKWHIEYTNGSLIICLSYNLVNNNVRVLRSMPETYFSLSSTKVPVFVNPVVYRIMNHIFLVMGNNSKVATEATHHFPQLFITL